MTYTLVYDADCGICTRFVAWVSARVGPDVRFVPLQSDACRNLPVTEDQCRKAAQWVDHRTLAVKSGSAAIAATLARARGGAKFLGGVIRLLEPTGLPGLTYRLVANSRRYLPGSSRCAVRPQASPD